MGPLPWVYIKLWHSPTNIASGLRGDIQKAVPGAAFFIYKADLWLDGREGKVPSASVEPAVQPEVQRHYADIYREGDEPAERSAELVRRADPP